MTVRVLKYFNVAVYALFVAVFVIFQYVQNETLLILAGMLGMTAVVAAIYTAVMLFGLRSDIINRSEDE